MTTAVQVGSYFVGQYYQVLQKQPDFVHQFYTDASTMLRIDGNASESASSMLQIHSLIMSLNFTQIEIKTAHSLESWNGGVLVMVSGSVQTKDYVGRRNFAQTIFLAPQETGYFVLNDIFHFLDEEKIHEHPAAIPFQNQFDSKLAAPSPFPEPGAAVSDYVQGGESQSREFVSSAYVEENDSVDQYSPSEQQPQQLPEPDRVEETQVEETPAEEPSSEFLSEMNTIQDSHPVPAEEPVGEPQKHTYASILRAARAQSTSSVAPQQSLNKSKPPPSEWHHAPQPTQQTYSAQTTGYERPGTEVAEEAAAYEDYACEGRSVYVRNLPSTITSFEIEQEFKNFGGIKPEGVVVRNRKDVDVCYAFVEFEELSGALNAIKASPILLGGRQVYAVERRPNTSSLSRGRGRGAGRGRGGYSTEAPRGGRYGGRSYGGRGQDGDYSNRSRGNGFQSRGSRSDRGILGNQASRNGQNSWD